MIVLGVILPCYTRSEDQLADVFTKAARQKTIESIHTRLGLFCPNGFSLVRFLMRKISWLFQA
ncbi:hypothetical protein YC2023_071611 [Brassica napus]